MLEQKINEFFGDAESTGFGTGWWSGVLSAFFGFLSFGAVLCLHFPSFVDDTLVRGFILVPLMLGFSQSIIVAYLIFVTIHATWTHCNFGPNAKWLEKYLVMPRYHHWHHTSQKEGIDKNFAIHFPWIDRLFGTYYYPEEWPELYGLDGEEISPKFFRQTVDPFTRRKKTP